jgi:hypothetical protein
MDRDAINKHLRCAAAEVEAEVTWERQRRAAGFETLTLMLWSNEDAHAATTR